MRYGFVAFVSLALFCGASWQLVAQATSPADYETLLSLAVKLRKQAGSLLIELEALKASSATLSAKVASLETDLRQANELSASLEQRLTDSLAESTELRMQLEALSTRLTSLSVQLAALETDYKTIKLQRDIYGWSALGLGILAIVAFLF